MKLCLGTVQFGLDYGINNVRGKVPEEEIPRILKFAGDSGIDMLDTAAAYGDSESVLGKAMAETGKNFRIITKYPANTEIRPLRRIDTSLESLKTERVYGYLFHNYSIFSERRDYIDDFVKVKESGKSEKTGFSLYYPYEAEYIMKNNIPCDIVQIPYNIFDQRFACLLPELKKHGIEIHVRSVFLQGLFFIAPEKLDDCFDSVKGKLTEINRLAEEYSINTAALCLAFACYNSDISHIVIGVDSLDDLRSNVDSCNLIKTVNIPCDVFERFAVDDENIILPFNWRK
ncbi:MAG: aldo/keto reductase [Chitinispirillales bacterium]|jgi:aryl-alcohol dehydrogenase-like predicted oxidoreductase|nr:aldo/keto reductase [Chitinispirillales bacterium]